MGSVGSNACKKCFGLLKKKKTYPLEYLELVEDVEAQLPKNDIEKPKINIDSDPNLLIKFEFLEIYNKPIQENCEKIIDKEGFLVYGQDIKEGFLIKAQWQSKHEPKKILEYMQMTEHRKKWDKNIELIEQVPGKSSDEFFTYAKYKKMIALSQRDMVIVSNIIETTDGIMIVSKSCNHIKYPEQEDFTRIKIFLGGYYFLYSNNFPYKTKVFTLTKANFGGSIPQVIIKKATALAFPKLYQGMEKCMDEYYK
jgi:START domain